MSDAQVFRYVQSGPGSGRKVVDVIGERRRVQNKLAIEAYRAAAKGNAALDAGAVERTGASSLKVEKGKNDWYVYLDDSKSQGAANIIEFGRKGNKPGSANNTHSRGVHPLEIAFGKYWDWS